MQRENNIYYELLEHKGQTVLVIADGAEFCPEIERIEALKRIMNIIVYSFEWMILKSELICGVDHVLESLETYIESKEYFSWERFFTSLLIDKTQDTYLRYKKAI